MLIGEKAFLSGLSLHNIEIKGRSGALETIIWRSFVILSNVDSCQNVGMTRKSQILSPLAWWFV